MPTNVTTIDWTDTTPRPVELGDGPLSPAARGLTWRWFDQSEELKDTGLHKAIGIAKLEALDPASGQVAGYLKVSYTTAELLDEISPTLLHWPVTHGGWQLDFDDPASLWAAAHLYASRTPTSTRRAPWSLSRDNAPDPATIAADLDDLVASCRFAERRQQWLAWAVNPWVDYSRVYDPWLGRGVGTALYVTAARQLARAGTFLRASSCQSDSALQVWDRLAAGPWPVGTVTLAGGYGQEPQTYRTLDFRS